MKRFIYILQLIYSTGFNMVFRLLPAYLTRFSSSASEIAMVGFAYNLAKSLNIFSGFAVDRIGKTRSIFMVLFVLSFVSIIPSMFTEIYQFALAFFVVGILANFYYTSINSLVGYYKNKTEAFFQLESVYQTGFVIGPILGGFLMSGYGGYAAFYTWSLLSFIGFGLSYLMMRKDETGKVTRTRQGIGFKDIFRSRKGLVVIFLGTGSFLTGIMFSMKDLAIPLYANSLGMDIYLIGIILGISSLVSVILLPVIGKFIKGVGKELSVSLGLVLMGASFLMINFSRDIVSIGILTGLFMVGRNMGLNLSRSFISENVSQDRMATGMSINDTIHFGGAVIGPLVAGLLIDFVSFSAVFYLVGALSFAGAAVVFGYSVIKK